MTTFHNVALNPEFRLRDEDSLKALFEADKTQHSLVENLDAEKYNQFVGPMAFGGLPENYEDAIKKIDKIEEIIRTTYAIPSKRPGGARSKGTGYVMPDTFKAYKSTVKRAYENGVELLDADGWVRPRNQVESDLKAIRENAAEAKAPEDKLMPMVTSLLAVLDKCEATDPRTVDAVNALLNGLKAKGWV